MWAFGMSYIFTLDCPKWLNVLNVNVVEYADVMIVHDLILLLSIVFF
jgi:hypothetical protein